MLQKQKVDHKHQKKGKKVDHLWKGDTILQKQKGKNINQKWNCKS